MNRIDAPKSKEELVRHFINCRGFGAMIVEGQEITAVCEHIEKQQAEIDKLVDMLRRVERLAIHHVFQLQELRTLLAKYSEK